MRSLVCAQCHVEYYFKDKTYLTFPWAKGLSVEKMIAYYDDSDFTDYVHAVSKTRIVKAQHPDYELYTTGIHSYRGVSCADCHMPYRSEGGVKFTDHHVQSPLLNIANACAVCHRWSEDEIRTRVESIQTKVHQAEQAAEEALVRAHLDVAAAMQAGVADESLKPARTLIRHAQFRWDYVSSSNGMGFHSAQEATRILGEAANEAQQARVVAARLLATKGVTEPIAYPNYATREAAWGVAAAFDSGEPPNLLP
jgi:nitrite reductase (cytochrome c-552)